MTRRSSISGGSSSSIRARSGRARADLASAIGLVNSGRVPQAFEKLQRIRHQFPGTREAEMALNYNTILYRLYVRKPAYSFSGRFVGAATDKFRDVNGVAIDETGRVLIGHKQGVSIFDAKGTALKNVPALEPSAFFVEGRDRVVLVRLHTLQPEGGTPIVINVPVAGRPARQPEEIPAVIILSDGDRLVVDRKAKTVLRVTSAGKFVSNFANLDVERLARNDVDDVAMIDRQNKSIALADRDGKIIARIPAKGDELSVRGSGRRRIRRTRSPLRAGQQQGRDPRLRAEKHVDNHDHRPRPGARRSSEAEGLSDRCRRPSVRVRREHPAHPGVPMTFVIAVVVPVARSPALQGCVSRSPAL